MVTCKLRHNALKFQGARAHVLLILHEMYMEIGRAIINGKLCENVLTLDPSSFFPVLWIPIEQNFKRCYVFFVSLLFKLDPIEDRNRLRKYAYFALTGFNPTSNKSTLPLPWPSFIYLFFFFYHLLDFDGHVKRLSNDIFINFCINLFFI